MSNISSIFSSIIENIFKHLDFIAFIILIIFIIYKNLTINKHVLYEDNGKRVHLILDDVDYNNVINQEQIDCNLDPENLVECNYNNSLFECFNCKNIYSKCVRFENDEILHNDFGVKIGTIPKNNPGKGYCMKINNPDINCLPKTGGKLILVKNEDGNYSFICYCTTPSLFDSLTKYSNCSVFRGCENGKIVEGWDSMENITCECNPGYTFHKIGIFPTCKFTKNEVVEVDYVAKDEFLLKEYRGLSLPNPCLFDAYTGEHVPTHLVELTMTNGIAHCRVIDQGEHEYTLIQFNDDYLLGNGGKYANGVVKFALLSNNLPTVYEYIDESHYLVGKLVKRNNFVLYDQFPYLDESSGNRGGSGPIYDYIPLLGNSYNISLVVYNAETPTRPPLNALITISFIPVFVSNFEATHKYFSGNIPFIEKDFMECGTMKMIFLAKGLGGKFPDFWSNGLEDLGKISDISVLKSTPFTSRYVSSLLCYDENKLLKMNQNSIIFTGIIANSKNYSYPLVISKQLTQKFRASLENWKSFDIKSSNFIVINDRYPEIAKDSFGASLTINRLYDDNEIGNPPKDYTKYNIERSIFKWSDTH